MNAERYSRKFIDKQGIENGTILVYVHFSSNTVCWRFHPLSDAKNQFYLKDIPQREEVIALAHMVGPDRDVMQSSDGMMISEDFPIPLEWWEEWQRDIEK